MTAPIARWPSILTDMEQEASGMSPCLRCDGTGTVFRATCVNRRSGEIEGYDDDCPQCGGSGEDER